MFSAFSTITASNRILKIVIVRNYFDNITAKQLDSQLSGLPISPIIEFELGSKENMPNLPLLRFENLVGHMAIPPRPLSM